MATVLAFWSIPVLFIIFSTISWTHAKVGSKPLIVSVLFILITRMLIVPMLALPPILLCPTDLSPGVTSDFTFRLSFGVIISSPTTINLIQICQINGYLERPMAGILFWNYCVVGLQSVLLWAIVGLWSAWRM
ncbi:hypothetical protein BGX27_009390 [Mortierella sp. AM989]|nr:hypothetical protein BGX27_009390 [Mortierella sp. AM989]